MTISYLSIWLLKSFYEVKKVIILDSCSKLFEVCCGTQLLLFYLDLFLDVIDAVCHQFGLFGTNFYLVLSQKVDYLNGSKNWETTGKLDLLVGCLGLNGFWDSVSFYIEPSQERW